PCPMASLIRLTLHRFGKNRVFVLLLAWLTLLPTWAPLPVNSQRRAISLLQTQIRGKEVGRIRAKSLTRQAYGRAIQGADTQFDHSHFGANGKDGNGPARKTS